MPLSKIISGGQTGVDRGALDAALVAGFECGGWCPADRGAEDGEIPERYPLTPLPAASTSIALGVRAARQVGEQYKARTLKNVQDSDGTAILFSGTLSEGRGSTFDISFSSVAQPVYPALLIFNGITAVMLLLAATLRPRRVLRHRGFAMPDLWHLPKLRPQLSRTRLRAANRT
jgi:hypothetical protein